MIARYVRFTVTKIRGANNVMQFNQLHLYSNSSRVLWNTSATTLSFFDAFADISERSIRIIAPTDNNKWCVVYGSVPLPPISVVIDNLSTINIDSYAYVTGNDSDERDPVSWTFEVSTDNLNWELVGSGTNENITNSRNTSTQLFPLFYYASPLMLLAC